MEHRRVERAEGKTLDYSSFLPSGWTSASSGSPPCQIPDAVFETPTAVLGSYTCSVTVSSPPSVSSTPGEPVLLVPSVYHLVEPGTAVLRTRPRLRGDMANELPEGQAQSTKRTVYHPQCSILTVELACLRDGYCLVALSPHCPLVHCSCVSSYQEAAHTSS